MLDFSSSGGSFFHRFGYLFQGDFLEGFEAALFLDFGQIWEPSCPPNSLQKPLKIDFKVNQIFDDFSKALESQLKRKMDANGSQNLRRRETESASKLRVSCFCQK